MINVKVVNAGKIVNVMENVNVIKVNVLDVASYIVNKCNSILHWKLQKLVYYSQCWHLVWENEVLFDEDIKAWSNSPVVISLYKECYGLHIISNIPNGNPNKLTKKQYSSIDAVIDYYGKMTSQELSDLIHSELPWKEARKGMSDRSNVEINNDIIKEYYSRL